MAKMSVGAKLIVGAVRIYQRGISRWTPAVCRFQPTCSEYAVQSVVKYGACKGCILAVKRIARCHPFNVGGYDPVP